MIFAVTDILTPVPLEVWVGRNWCIWGQILIDIQGHSFVVALVVLYIVDAGLETDSYMVSFKLIRFRPNVIDKL